MATKSSSTTVATFLITLRAELENVNEHKAEALAAHLLSRLLGDIGVFVSKTGSQFGGDAGTVGLQHRRVRLECKRYKQTTHLSPRALAGEVVEASLADPHLEAWVLVATKEVSERERNLARDEAEKRGLPIVIIDWTAPAAGAGINALAALCAQWPDVVEAHVNKAAADVARGLTAHIGHTVDNLRRDLEMWNIGFESLRKKSAAYLQRAWVDSSQAKAALNQDAAGGKAGVHLLDRKDVLQGLSNWWLGPSDIRAPVAVTGLEGVGKTWAVLDWVNRASAMLPIVLPFPASTFVGNQDFSDAGIRDLIASSLRRITGSHQGQEHWRLRVDRLLERPAVEGVAFLLLVDGLNQQPFVPWVALAQTLQGDTLAGRMRMLCTSRMHYFEEDMRQFRELDARPTQVRVGAYSPGELEQLLGLHGMSSSDLPPGLLNLASIPRLFPLVVRLKDKDAMRSDASVLRLLFEYGKDVHEIRQQGALTDTAWVEWLAGRAQEYRERLVKTGARHFTTTIPDVADSLDVASVSREEVARRLSDLVDGGLFHKESSITGTRKLVLKQEPTVLGLGIALLDSLSGATDSFETVQTKALEWLEPVAAIDLASEVLKAALAILSATGTPDKSSITDALLVLWMNGQNPSVDIERDAFAFGESFPRSMLIVVERSSLSAQSAAFHYAVQSLRRLPTARVEDWNTIRSRMLTWTGSVLLPDKNKLDDPNHYARHHHDNLVQRIGFAEQGIVKVHGEVLNLDYSHPGDPSVAIPGILEGHSLSTFLPVIRRAAVRQAVQVDLNSRCWEGLRWVLLVACQNPDKVRDEIAQMAELLLLSTPEQGIHPQLRNRAAAYLLRLTGVQKYEERASQVNETFGKGWDYQAEYLDKPGRSFFELEYQHIDVILKDDSLSLERKLDRLSPFLALPNLKLPDTLIQSIVKELENLEFIRVDEAGQRTAEKHGLDGLIPLGARFAPTELAHMSRRWLNALSDRRNEQKYWAAFAAPESLLIADKESCAKFAVFRTASSCLNRNQFANTWSLQLELLHKSLEEQLQLLLQAEEYHFLTDLVAVVRPAKSSELLEFLQAAGEGAGEKAARIVMEVMAHQTPRNANELAQGLLQYLQSGREEVRGVAFAALAKCAPEVTGRTLMAANWKADAIDPWAAHYGSKALVAATKHLPLDDVLLLIAPWQWLEAAVSRGGILGELELASCKLLTILGTSSQALPSAEGILSVRMPEQSELARVTVTEPADTKEDFGEALKRAARYPEDVNKRMEQLAKDAAATIERIRSSGHGLYLHTFDFETVEAAYRAAPSVWQMLLVGAETQSKEFQRRVHLAEGLYLCLCEVLLVHEPAKGLRLWRALLGSMKIRFNGPAKIPELVHIVLRAPDSPEVLSARAELAGILHCNTDQDLLELVIAAEMHGRDAWLEKLIAEDEASDQLWRRKRALVLKGLHILPPLDQLRWPEGQPIGSAEALKRRFMKWTNQAVLAKYWWDKFITAPDVEQAFAAWHIFLSCADRRAWVWRLRGRADTSDLGRLRELHLLSNKDLYSNKLNKPEDGAAKLGDHFLGLDKPGKWLTLDGAQSR